MLFHLNFFFWATLHDMWDLSSPTRNRTCAPCSGSTVLTTGLPGKAPPYFFKLVWLNYKVTNYTQNIVILENSKITNIILNTYLAPFVHKWNTTICKL